MGLAGQNQVRQIYLGEAPSGVSDLATLKNAGVAHDLVILSKGGEAVSGSSDVKVFQKNTLGDVISSDTVKGANVLYSASVKYAAATKAKYTLSGLSAINAGVLYTVQIIVKGFGSLSPEDEYIKKGFYEAEAGDNAEKVVDKLIESLNANFSREVGANASSNKMFTFSKTGTTTTAALVIEEKDDWKASFDGNTMSRHELDFEVDVKSEDTFVLTQNEVASSGSGTGYQVMEMEHFLLGERGDTYRTAGYPHNLKTPPMFSSAAGVAGKYNMIELDYYDEGRNEAKKSKKQITIVVPFNGSDYNDVNTVIDDLNTALGTSIANLSA